MSFPGSMTNIPKNFARFFLLTVLTGILLKIIKGIKIDNFEAGLTKENI